MKTSETTPTKSSDVVTTAGSPASSSEGSDIHDNPDYIAPDQADMMLMDVTSEKLHGEISENLGVTYLSQVASPEHQVAPLFGQLYGLNGRLMVNVETRRMSRRGSQIQYPRFNVIFLCDTGAPNTYLCEETLNIMLGNPENIPSSMHIHLANFPAVQAYLSPKNGHYADVNVIGMDLMSRIQTTIYGADREFKLELMSHRTR
mmetsp:Transcript_35837/g.86433  ORF Transcript_35837/g.86433 Transcript_35837/m.86433 type:complete len:203 (+) Transcript_35837:77-685(+)